MEMQAFTYCRGTEISHNTSSFERNDIPRVGKLTDQYNVLLHSLSFISKDGLYTDISFGISLVNLPNVSNLDEKLCG